MPRLSIYVVTGCLLHAVISVESNEVKQRFLWDYLKLPFDAQRRCLECYTCNCHPPNQTVYSACSTWSTDCLVIVDNNCKYPYHFNGAWGSWSSWGRCTDVYCGANSHQSRFRLCDNPPPHNCGKCQGSSTELRPCDSCNAKTIPSSIGPTSTSTPTTAGAQQTTQSASVFQTCNKFCVTSISSSVRSYTHPDASKCSDGTLSGPEAVPLTCCNVPATNTWKPGANMMSNCNSVPLYTPVAIFAFGHYVTGTSGIFIGCLGNSSYGFQIIRQTCGRTPLVESVVRNSTVDSHPDSYFTIQ